jgi:hypothetical protein
LGADLITKGVHNGIANRHIEQLRQNIGGTKKRVSQAVKGKKTIEETFPQGTKSDIERGEKARNKYRADIDRIFWTEKKDEEKIKRRKRRKRMTD